jgi:ABC-type multidrug transport system fused ATPase/permease subunit
MQQSEDSQREILRALLERRKRMISANKKAQYDTARWHNFWHYFLRILSIFLSLAVGTSLFVSIEKQFGEQVKFWLAVSSFIAAFLSFVQIFLRSNELVMIHKSFATKFAEIERRIDFLLASPPEKLTDYKKAIERIDAEINVVAKDAPLIKNNEPETVVWAVK